MHWQVHLCLCGRENIFILHNFSWHFFPRPEVTIFHNDRNTFPCYEEFKKFKYFFDPQVLTSNRWKTVVIGIKHIYSWSLDQPDAGNVFNEVMWNSDRLSKTFSGSLNVLIWYHCFHNCANRSSKVLIRLQLRSVEHKMCLFASLEITECHYNSHECLMSDKILARLTLSLYCVKSFLNLVHYVFFQWSNYSGIFKAYPIIPFYANLFRHQTRFSNSRENTEHTLNVQGNFGLIFHSTITWMAALPFFNFLVSSML